jgi:hypothetical protein
MNNTELLKYLLQQAYKRYSHHNSPFDIIIDLHISNFNYSKNIVGIRFGALHRSPSYIYVWDGLSEKDVDSYCFYPEVEIKKYRSETINNILI